MHRSWILRILLQDDYRSKICPVYKLDRARNKLRRFQCRRVQQNYPGISLQTQQRKPKLWLVDCILIGFPDSTSPRL